MLSRGPACGHLVSAVPAGLSELHPGTAGQHTPTLHPRLSATVWGIYLLSQMDKQNEQVNFSVFPALL